MADTPTPMAPRKPPTDADFAHLLKRPPTDVDFAHMRKPEKNPYIQAPQGGGSIKVMTLALLVGTAYFAYVLHSKGDFAWQRGYKFGWETFGWDKGDKGDKGKES